jgi:CRISPR-associated protein Cas1
VCVGLVVRDDDELLDRYAGLLREQFNSGVVYGSDHLQWDTLILRKCQEFARFLVGKTDRFELVAPQPVLVREDTKAVRDRIRNLTSSEAGKLGIGKSTLHYLRKNAKGTGSFTVYKKVRTKLDSSEPELVLHQTA